MAKHRKEGAISAQAFRDILTRHRLRQEDAAWMTGVGARQARAWATGEYGVPLYAALILQAYDQGLIDAGWLAQRIPGPPPA